MGIRHLKYKTENAHYGAVGENLLAILEEHLSKEGEWSDELKNTWAEAINTVAQIMIDAASNPETYADELVHAGYGKDGFRGKDPEPWKLN